MRYTISFIMLTISVLLCSCGAISAVPAVNTASEPTAPMQALSPSPALTQTPPPDAPTDSVPQSADAWAQVRAQIPADVPVSQPTWVPERFGPPYMGEVATSSNSESVYTVVYSAKDESLAFILNNGKGAMGNFPPPETKEQITVHGIRGQLLTSKETSTTGVFWQESGQSYQIKVFSKHITKEELLRITESLVEVVQ